MVSIFKNSPLGALLNVYVGWVILIVRWCTWLLAKSVTLISHSGLDLTVIEIEKSDPDKSSIQWVTEHPTWDPSETLYNENRQKYFPLRKTHHVLTCTCCCCLQEIGYLIVEKVSLGCRHCEVLAITHEFTKHDQKTLDFYSHALRQYNLDTMVDSVKLTLRLCVYA